MKSAIKVAQVLNLLTDKRPLPQAALTVCARMSTPRRLRTTPKMAARLSMLGLPRSDSIRCRLLLGVFVSAARASNPTDAFIRSRSTKRAACGSPLRNSVAASSSRALAKAGSRASRALTVSLKSRVSAILLPFILRLAFRRLPGLVLGEQRFRSSYVCLLALFGTADKQDN
jgi:hypothetical protein